MLENIAVVKNQAHSGEGCHLKFMEGMGGDYFATDFINKNIYCLVVIAQHIDYCGNYYCNYSILP